MVYRMPKMTADGHFNLERCAMNRIGRFFLASTALLFTPACQAACRNEVIDSVKSPNGVYTAVSFERNCDATSGNNLQVSIIRSDSPLYGPGNTLVIDYPNDYYLHEGREPKVALHWKNESSITIEYSSDARIFTKAIIVQSIKIDYLIK